MTDNLTPLCQINGGCMGCCGHDFVSKEKIQETVRLNTIEFNEINPRVKAQFMKFRDRAHPSNLRNGVCRNLIEKGGNIFCPLHPTLHDEDLRRNHCDIKHLCGTAKKYAEWNQDKQEKFISFVANKNIDNLEYSMGMDKGTLLKEFLEFLEV
jgi:hypothetical protein